MIFLPFPFFFHHFFFLALSLFLVLFRFSRFHTRLYVKFQFLHPLSPFCFLLLPLPFPPPIYLSLTLYYLSVPQHTITGGRSGGPMNAPSVPPTLQKIANDHQRNKRLRLQDELLPLPPPVELSEEGGNHGLRQVLCLLVLGQLSDARSILELCAGRGGH